MKWAILAFIIFYLCILLMLWVKIGPLHMCTAPIVNFPTCHQGFVWSRQMQELPRLLRIYMEGKGDWTRTVIDQLLKIILIFRRMLLPKLDSIRCLVYPQ